MTSTIPSYADIVPCAIQHRQEAEVVRVDRFEARCWCGWSQLHTSAEAAAKDAGQHEREWHGAGTGDR